MYNFTLMHLPHHTHKLPHTNVVSSFSDVIGRSKKDLFMTPIRKSI